MSTDAQRSTGKTRNWPIGVAGVIAFGLGMIVSQIESAGWGIVLAIVGAALSYAIAIMATRLMTRTQSEIG